MIQPTLHLSPRRAATAAVAVAALVLLVALAPPPAAAADHNDPNAVNSIFSDIGLSAADLYDMFGWPVDGSDGSRVVLALTFAPVPEAGVFDTDLLYRIRLDAAPRVGRPLGSPDEHSLEALGRYAKAVGKKYGVDGGMEVRVVAAPSNRLQVDFIGFPEGDFSETLAANRVHEVTAPGGETVKLYLGARDDAFFNDLPGFFRSINYAPQFYRVPHAWSDRRELPIPKTLLELEGNELFNFDPVNPRHGQGVKTELPPGPYTWDGTDYKRDENGDFRFVYSGTDAQAGIDINAIVVELPMELLTRRPERDRIVNAWGESWVLRAADKVEHVDDGSKAGLGSWWHRVFGRTDRYEEQLRRYKRVDTDGIPFSDAALSERHDSRQLGAENLKLARHFVQRFGHLGWGFAPSISALGLDSCFDHGDVTVPVHRTYALASAAFPRVKRCFFQELNMPDDSWNPKGLDIPLRRPFEVFLPNVNSIDMDTTGSWPFGRRPEDQVATRFLSVFLDQADGCGGPCDLETLGRQEVWDTLPISPKTPPNPLANDKPFLETFPYLAEPHGQVASGDAPAGAATAPEPPDDDLHRLYTTAAHSGQLGDWQRLWDRVEAEMERSGAPELLLYRATVAVELHRLDAAAEALDRLGAAAGDSYPRQLRADIALQRGRADAARRVYESLLAERRSWDRLARLAYLERRGGDRAEADRLYAEAQEQLTAKELGAFAWLELQRGILDLDRQDHGAALDHFERADRADPGHWLIEEHRAEALAALGRRDEAEAIYRRVVETTGAPEYLAALAEVVAVRDAAEATRLHDRTREAFQELYQQLPAAVAGHYADYLLEHRPDDPRLLEAAERDHALRPNPDTRLRLAEVLLTRGEIARARELLTEVEASGWNRERTREVRRALSTRQP